MDWHAGCSVQSVRLTPARLALFAVLAPGCLGDPGLEPGAGGLVNATADTEHPGVGVVRIGPGACSGTLVAPRVVLTVKHCFPTGPLPRIRFLVGPNAETEAGEGVRIFYRTPPEGYHRQSDDLVAILLDQDAPVVPIPVRRAPLSHDHEGRVVSLVGFGVTASGNSDFGARRSGPATIESISGNELETHRESGQVSSCDGDSGGALVLDGELAGVIIGSVWLNCYKTSVHTRVDRYLDVVDQALAAAAEGAPQAPAPVPAGGQSDADQDAPPDDGVHPNASLCGAGFCEAGDGYCDENLDCCDSDADCSPSPEEPPDPASCDCDLTWNCDGCWCEPAGECEEPAACDCDVSWGCDGCWCEPVDECP